MEEPKQRIAKLEILVDTLFYHLDTYKRIITYAFYGVIILQLIHFSFIMVLVLILLYMLLLMMDQYKELKKKYLQEKLKEYLNKKNGHLQHNNFDIDHYPVFNRSEYADSTEQNDFNNKLLE